MHFSSPGSNVPASTVSRRHVLRSFAALAASTFLSGCGADLYRSTTASSTPNNQPNPSRPSTQANMSNTQPVPAGPLTAASMSVSAATAASLSPGFTGLAFEKQSLSTPLFSGSAAELIALFKLLGPGVLRVGGASVDTTVWAPDGAGQIAGQVSPRDVAALAAFLQATGWSCLYGVNLGGLSNGSTTPALAAAEVAYVAQQLGPALIGVELGNECERYGDPGSFYAGDWTLQQFEALWMQMHDAIVAATPSAPLAGPVSATDIDTWAIPFGEYVSQNRIGLLTQHYARATDPTLTATQLLTADPALASQLLQLYFGADSIDVPFRITGCTPGAAPATGITDTYASALWAIDTLFGCAIGGASGVNFQAGSQSAASLLTDVQGTHVATQPGFYGLVFAAMAGTGSMLSTQLDAAALNVSGYAVQIPGGGLTLVVLNKDATQNLELSIGLPVATKTGCLRVLTQQSAGESAPDPNALAGITIQGASIAADGSFSPGDGYAIVPNGSQVSCYVPAMSAVLLQLA